MPTSPAKRPPLAIPILFTVVFIDLVGFGILMPLVPFYVERLGARPELITLIIAAHPLAQSIALPFWGALSDRFGRKPVLLASMAGHVGAYLLMGFADSLLLLLASRVLSGATSANIATAYAYISDVTPAEERAAALGKISAAFGLGFVLGPAIGGLLAGGGSIAEANLLRPALAAAGFSAVAFLAILFFLPESRRADSPSGSSGMNPLNTLSDLRQIASRPLIRQMLFVGTLVLVFLSVRESIFPLWANHRLGLTAQTLGFMLAWTGLVMSLIQFFAMGWLARRFGEVALVKTALLCLMVGWLGFALSFDIWSLLLAMTIGSFGTAFFQTSMQSLLSQRAGASERGRVLGTYQSASALARFVGQGGAGTLYGQIAPNAPFLLGSLAMLPALWLAGSIGRRLQVERRRGTRAGAHKA
ncbi:MAG: MFS transporter [Chromatiales bacterium]|nr:MFS transporter [Chromatiales bacterium]